MVERFNIAGYCRISVDEESDRENTSIENQKAIISDYVKRRFPDSTLDFYQDRDRSGYTFEQREEYQKMRPQLMTGYYDILIVKDFSRFSRRNSRGLVELEDLRDAGVRIISIGDGIDYPLDDEWTAISFRFLINEMPVTDASKKVRSVITRRQNDGKWICAVPYGYVITNSKNMTFEIDEPSAEVVRKIFALYIDGWGYKRIANYLTEQRIPTPRMVARARKEAKGEECKLKARAEWSIVTVQGIIEDDFYIGTLRQGKYNRKKINGKDIKKDESEHIVFENHHEAIIDYRTFATAKEQCRKRSSDHYHYRGVKKYDNVYSGLMECGDCGSPMFALSRPDLEPAYRCGAYHRRGRAGCTSHYIREGKLDEIVKIYLTEIRSTSSEMIKKLEEQIADEASALKTSTDTLCALEKQLEDAKEELKILIRQKVREVMRKPDEEELIEETYEELMNECRGRITGLENQIVLMSSKQNTVVQVNRVAKTAIDAFDGIISKDKLDKKDLDLIVERIYIFEDSIQIKLKADVENILNSGKLPEGEIVNFNSGIMDITQKQLIQTVKNRKDKVYDVNVISNGDPLEIYTDADGEVIFKKYSPIGELSSITAQYAEVLNRSTGLPVIVTDRDSVIACAGISRREVIDRRVSQSLEGIMEKRENYVFGSGSERVKPVEGLDKEAGVAFPIIGGGDVSGAVLLLLGENGDAPTQTEIKLAQVAASFLGRQMEE